MERDSWQVDWFFCRDLLRVHGQSKLERPHPGITVYYFRCMAVRTIWTGFEANFPAVKGAVGNARNLLVVDVDGNGTALGYHGNQVTLAHPLLDG